MSSSSVRPFILLSLTALPITSLLETIDTVAPMSPSAIAAAAAIICSSLLAAAWLCAGRWGGGASRFWIAVFTFFMFGCVVDFLLALAAAGVVSTGSFYLTKGEVYLNTAHGIAINTWDCTVHYCLYIHFITCCTRRKSHAPSALWWAGSIMNSLFVLSSGAVLGPHPLKPSAMLNLPFILLPLAYAAAASAPPTSSSSPSDATAAAESAGPPASTRSFVEQQFSSAMRICGCIFCCLYAIISIVQGLWAADVWQRSPRAAHLDTYSAYDHDGFARAQCLVNAAITAPIALLIAVCFTVGSNSSFSEPLLKKVLPLFSGMLAQGSFAYVVGGYIQPNPDINLSASLDLGVPLAVLLFACFALPLSLCGCLHAKPLAHVEVLKNKNVDDAQRRLELLEKKMSGKDE